MKSMLPNKKKEESTSAPVMLSNDIESFETTGDRNMLRK